MKLNLETIIKTFITLLVATAILMMYSCGSRKVQKTIIKEETKTEQTAKVNNDISINNQTKTVINEDADEIEVKPIDTSKAIVVNGKTYKNSIVTLRKKKVNTVIENKEIVKDLSVKHTKAIITAKKQEVKRNVERKSNPFLPLLWLLIPAAIYLVWKYKYKIVGLW